jgi:hypothetical protein
MTRKEREKIRKDKKAIKDEVKKYRGELVLNFFEVMRLDGFEEDDMDYYYVYTKLHGDKERYSCCCGFIPLKGLIRDKDYIWLE